MTNSRPLKDYQETLNPKTEPKPKGWTIREVLRTLLLGFVCSSVVICGLLRWVPPPTSAFMLYRHFEDLIANGSFKSIQYQWVSGEKISKNAYQAVLASEDQRFFEHVGFDLKAIQAAIGNYIHGGSLRGASTLSQQVAKNLFLTPTKSFIRKGLEVWFTILCEVLLGKERILVLYLNIAEFGDHLFGIEAASRYYFGVSAQKINREQASMLAATLPNPIVLKVLNPSRAVLSRQHWILRQMRTIDPSDTP